MKITFKNLGPLRQAELEMGDFTIICGRNNTGKTYATYSIYGFLSYWKEVYSIPIPREVSVNLLANGSAELNVEKLINEVADHIKDASQQYTKKLADVFASDPGKFAEASFTMTVDLRDIDPIRDFKRTIGSAKSQIFSVTKEAGKPNIILTLLVDKEQTQIPEQIIEKAIGDAIKDIIYGNTFPNPIISSAERTGVAIFRKELDFARNRLLEHMNSLERDDLNPFAFLDKVYSSYAMPIRANVEFTRKLEDIEKKDSFIARENASLLDDFRDIIGGDYRVSRGDLYYVPAGNPRLKLTMDESSSGVRSLLDIGFYLRHVAQRGDLLMVDEPELNLHPQNQRLIARLFARLVNLGIKVFITTHSDYIIKELNTLIMLNQTSEHTDAIREKQGYKTEELISSNRLKVYIAEKSPVKLDGKSKKSRVQTLVQADIDPQLGIEARSFDETIDEMNRIQEAILFGEVITECTE